MAEKSGKVFVKCCECGFEFMFDPSQKAIEDYLDGFDEHAFASIHCPFCEEEHEVVRVKFRRVAVVEEVPPISGIEKLFK